MRAFSAPLLLTLLGVVATASPAQAQQSDATDRLGSVEGENPFGRDRNIGVLERRRPAYTPEPLHIGIVELLPSLAIGGGYDDNLFASERGRIGDGYVRVRPRVSLVRPSPNLRLSLNGELDLLRYASRTTEDTTQYLVSAGAQYTISKADRFDLSLSHGRFAEERVSPDSPTGVISPNRFTITQGSASYAHTFNRLRLSSVLEVERRDYRNGVTPAGVVVDQDFRDRTSYTGTGIAEYALSPSIALFVAGSVNQRDYRERSGPVPARDSSGFEVAAGSSFELGRKARGSPRLGYLRQDYKAAQFTDISGFLVRGELAYFLTPLVTITGTVDRGIRETGLAGATGFLATNFTLRADYELLRNLIISAGGELEKRDYNLVDRRDDRWRLRANASWLISRRLSVRADLQHRIQDSFGATPGRRFDDTRVSIGVTLAGL